MALLAPSANLIGGLFLARTTRSSPFTDDALAALRSLQPHLGRVRSPATARTTRARCGGWSARHRAARAMPTAARSQCVGAPGSARCQCSWRTAARRSIRFQLEPVATAILLVTRPGAGQTGSRRPSSRAVRADQGRGADRPGAPGCGSAGGRRGESRRHALDRAHASAARVREDRHAPPVGAGASPARPPAAGRVDRAPHRQRRYGGDQRQSLSAGSA